MSKVLKFSAIAVLLLVIAVQWHALSTLRQENRILQKRAMETEQARVESASQPESHPPQQSAGDPPATEVLRLRNQVHSLQDDIRQASNRAQIFPTEQLPLALRGNAELPRRVLPPAGPLPRDFDQYRLQMRYTGLTTVLQKREADGSYTDVIEGAKEIGLGDKHLFVYCWPDPSRISGSWLFIDLDTGEAIEKPAIGPEEDKIAEGESTKWIKRDTPQPNDPQPQNWKVLFR